jgi:hypothetical protein
VTLLVLSLILVISKSFILLWILVFVVILIIHITHQYIFNMFTLMILTLIISLLFLFLVLHFFIHVSFFISLISFWLSYILVNIYLLNRHILISGLMIIYRLWLLIDLLRIFNFLLINYNLRRQFYRFSSF